MAELVDALDLGSGIARCGGSSPLRSTKNEIIFIMRLTDLIENNKNKIYYHGTDASFDNFNSQDIHIIKL